MVWWMYKCGSVQVVRGAYVVERARVEDVEIWEGAG